ncbi:hypothetical protein DRO49_00535 [Candidatus Bathyarchaeota archaeon]|nr:MAG: hypothetical protein DRO49_00535 [Candidatus Bathyarchaeota archaeon]
MADTNIRPAKKFAFDVGWVFISSVIVLMLHFFQKPVMARYLGPDGLGLFSMAFMIIGIVEIIAGFGIGEALVKYVAEYREYERVSSLTSSAFITISVFGIITSVALFFSSNLFADIFDMPYLSILLKIYAIAFPFSLIYGIILGFLRGLRKMKYFAFLRILDASLALAFILAFLAAGFWVEGAMLGILFEIIVIFVVGMLIMKKFMRFSLSDYQGNTKMLASFGSRIIGANIVGQIYYNIDTLMIGYFLTSTEVGYYAVAISLSRFFWLVPRAIATVAYPAISEYWANGNRQAVNKLVDKSTKYSACILIFAGMSIVFFAKDIITFLFTPEFLPAVLPLAILITGTVTSGILRSVGEIFASVGKVNLVLKISIIGAVGDIILNMILIPIYGIIGAATATAASQVLNVGITIYFLRKALVIKLDTPWFIKMVMLISLLAVLFYGLSILNHYFSATIALFLYTIAIIKYFLTKEDKAYFVSIVKHALYGDFIKV